MAATFDRDGIVAEQCRRSLFRFLQEFWEVIIPDPPVWNWHIEVLCAELQVVLQRVIDRQPKLYDLAVNVPPGTTKSTIFSQASTAWMWTNDPSIRHISSSYSMTQSTKNSLYTRRIVQSEKYKRLFPEVVLREDQAGKTDFATTAGGQRFTSSVSGTIMGEHSHVLTVDDPLNADEAFSDKERLKANEFVTTTLQTRMVDKEVTPIILIMQRLHEDDPTAALIEASEEGDVRHICIPAEISEQIKPPELAMHYREGLMDVNRMGRPVLAKMRKRLGSYKYGAQFEQTPSPADGGIFKKDWFEVVEWEPRFAGAKWNFVADTAYTKKEMDGNDPSGFLAYAEIDNVYYIRSFKRVFDEFPDLCKSLPKFCMAHGYHKKRSIIEVEPKASGKSVVQQLRSKTRLNIKEGKVPVKDKVARANEASPECECGRVRLISGAWNTAFIDELSVFPNGAHDEAVDCLTMMLKRRKRRGNKRRN